MENIDEKELTFEYVRERLLTAEARESEDFSAIAGESGALIAASTSAPLVHDKFNTRSTTRSNNRSTAKCGYCGKNGHVERGCFKLHPELAPTWWNKPHKFNSTNICMTAKQEYACSASCQITTTSQDDAAWVIDSGATWHMARDRATFNTYTELLEDHPIRVGDGRVINAIGRGDIIRKLSYRDRRTIVTLVDVLHVPALQHNLLSINLAMERLFDFRFCSSTNQCLVVDTRSGTIIGSGAKRDHLYFLVEDQEQANIMHRPLTVITARDLWHQRYGHLHHGALNTLKRGLVTGLPRISGAASPCKACVLAKHARSPFPDHKRTATDVLALVHSDVCGPIQVNSKGGARYFVTFIDDCSRYVTVYCLPSKDGVLECFKQFQTEAERQTGKKLKVLRSDNGGEYTSKAFEDYCSSKGVRREKSISYTPQQNGVAERMNRTLMECVRAMLTHAQLDKSLWAEAVTSAVYVRNRSPTSALKQKTPYQVWTGKIPDVRHFRVWGCDAYVHINDVHRKKLDVKSKLHCFVGYSDTQKGYRLLCSNTGKILISRDVKFREQNFSAAQPQAYDEFAIPVPETARMPEPVGDPLLLSDNEESDSFDTSTEEEEQPIPSARRYPSRNRQPPTPYPGILMGEQAFDNIDIAMAAIDKIPTSLSAAMRGPDGDRWKAAAQSEMDSLHKKETWTLVDKLPPGKNLVSNKWVFTHKRDSTGKIVRYKARLVARGFSQREGIDYEEVFAPVVRYGSIRVLLAVANQHNMEVDQLDVKTAYLNGRIDSEVYMSQPDGFVDPQRPDAVCRIQRSLYGLKQSGRCWNAAFNEFLLSRGYTRSVADPCVYVKHAASNVVMLALYVDDIVIACTTRKMLNAEKQQLMEGFEMEDQGPVHYVLGMTIQHNRTTGEMCLAQRSYLEHVLQRFNMAESRPAKTPMEVNANFNVLAPNEAQVNQAEYQAAIGCLLWLSMGTRPDIAQAVAVLARVVTNPSDAHWTGVKRVLRYLNGTRNLCLRYKKSDEPSLVGMSDADWAGDVINRRSTTGFVFAIGGTAVSWLSKQQPVVALSSCEAEYIALSAAVQELLWLNRLLCELGFKDLVGTVIYEDNQGAIALAKNPVGHKRTKHIDTRYHFIREKVDCGELRLQYCPTQDMTADVFTKGLSINKFAKFRIDLGVVPNAPSGSVSE